MTSKTKFQALTHLHPPSLYLIVEVLLNIDRVNETDRVCPYSLVTSCSRQVRMVLGLINAASKLQDDKGFKVVYICIT
jgi:hypothetical protein